MLSFLVNLPRFAEEILDTIQRDSVISFPGLGISGLNPPAYFTVFGRPIYFYGVLIALGFLTAILYCSRRSSTFPFSSPTALARKRPVGVQKLRSTPRLPQAPISAGDAPA